MENNEEILKTITQFNKWADSYDRGIWSLYFNYCYKKIIKIIEPYLVGRSKVLDTGCGTGNLIIALSYFESVNELVGIDISEKMLERANFKRERAINKDKIKLFAGDIRHMPFQDNTFDVVFSLNAFHHHIDTLGEMRRVLKSGGLFVLVDNFLDNPLRQMWANFLKVYFKENNVEYYSKKEREDLLNANGFRVLGQKNLLYFVLASVCEKK